MSKKIKDYTFGEYQAHANGILEGLGLGTLLTINVISFVYIVYEVLK